MFQPCSSPTGPIGPIGSDPEFSRQVNSKGCEGFSKVINQHPEEDAKCLQFTRLRIRVYTGTSYDKRVKHRGDKSRTKLESEQSQSQRSGGGWTQG